MKKDTFNTFRCQTKSLSAGKHKRRPSKIANRFFSQVRKVFGSGMGTLLLYIADKTVRLFRRL